ncbi:uncharacterized protein (TIGR03089 family) [Stackebrandtia endophytica]|uniref:Uncharacterized protein (TIGR03089 family) n=1 Tax=Stackebrandtia endophytica TaxID=1496996 RepID=A0A543AQN2_9ACTN|nr:TIGR03089 family protein [Stackebrandtia endophytica]TQL74835.1 uncharacterized protein (TIGR03089 family) [Stackebrandtia endophytica]
MDIAVLFDRAAGVDPARPFITFYDDATGERTELSYLTFDNWVSKTANLLIDEAGLTAGDTVSVCMPPHWLSGAIMVAGWRAGMAISHDGGDADIAFATVDRLDQAASADQVYAVSTAPLAIGLRGADAEAAEEAGASDFLTEVRGHGDHFRASQPIDPDAPALVGLPGGGSRSQRELVEAAADRAGELGVSPAQRIMFSAERLRPIDWLLVPMAAAGSVVLCRNSAESDLVKRAGSENARHIG